VARYRNRSGRFVYVQAYRAGSVTAADVKKQALDNARRFAARHPGGTGDRQPTEPRAGCPTAQLIFNGRPEPFEMTSATGARDIAVGSPMRYILHGFYGATILSPGKIIASRSYLKEERGRTGS
jgi:hypothetical protein